MIFDCLENLGKYRLIPHVDEVLEFIASNNVFALEAGDIAIRGEELFVKVLEYIPKPACDNYFETHKIYTDVQIVFRGIEEMQVTGEKNLEAIGPYDDNGDFQFFNSDKNVSEIVVCESEFLVFFPGGAHKPGCRYRDLNEPVLKLVFKIKDDMGNG